MPFASPNSCEGRGSGKGPVREMKTPIISPTEIARDIYQLTVHTQRRAQFLQIIHRGRGYTFAHTGALPPSSWLQYIQPEQTLGPQKATQSQSAIETLAE